MPVLDRVYELWSENEVRNFHQPYLVINIFCLYKFNLNFSDLRADQFDSKLEKIWFWQGKDVKGRRIFLSLVYITAYTDTL